ncbi:MAG: 3-deoxy-D-manno-octulosonic acid transferase [Chitinophagales bacterium]
MFIQKAIYNISIRAYYIALWIVSFFNKKAKLWIDGRKIKIEKVENAESIWFHCASLGEFEQARPLLEKLKKDYPHFKIVLTFFSPSGYEIRKNYSEADFVYYLPLDTKKKAEEFIRKINPKMVFFIKYEFWFNFLEQLHIKKINTYLVSGIFRSKQSFFKPYGKLFRKMLGYFSHLFVQNENSLQLLKSIDLKNISQANDTRFDRVVAIRNKAKTFPEIEQFVDNKPCIVLGSSWLVDDKLFKNSLETLNNYKLIIAPHDINNERIKEVQSLFPNSILYSDIKKYRQEKVLIINNMGMLSSIYQYGQIAYIGGGFGVSIHNILEAAVYGIPVLFGPAHHKMKEAADLIANKGGFEVNNLGELKTILTILKNKEKLQKSSNSAFKYVQENTGGTEKILSFLKKEKIIQKI